MKKIINDTYSRSDVVWLLSQLQYKSINDIERFLNILEYDKTQKLIKSILYLIKK